MFRTLGGQHFREEIPMNKSAAALAHSTETKDQYRNAVEEMFDRADVRINGDRSFDIRVRHPEFYKRIIGNAQLGLGESYMDGWWECDSIAEMTRRFILAGLHKSSLRNLRYLSQYLSVKLSGIGSRGKAFEVGEKHYDLGNDLFRAMLDQRMIYSCAYWKNADTLDRAQESKLDLVCRKLALKPGMKVLEIGCGWGGWAKYAAEKYKLRVVGLTVSAEQAKLAREECAGLPVEIRLEDYRSVTGEFDRVVSIAMFEAVGHNYYREFMRVAHRCLKDDGLFLLHTIVSSEPVGAAEAAWLNKYIFPNGELPSLAQIMKAAEGLFMVEALHRFGSDYDRTLQSWLANFDRNWPSLSSSYDERFRRMWRFYLQISSGIFQSRVALLWQIVFSKNGFRRLTTTSLDYGAEWLEAR
jgi:cyclopropane-fatty-acyl-phospholipid synthase